MEPIIELKQLSKHFGKTKALDQIDLSVPPGAIGLLGPNGAGKSTLMKCLLQLIPYDEGNAFLLGRDIKKEGRHIRERIGYLPEQDCYIPGMVGSEYVTYCAQLCGLPFEAARQRAHELLDFVGLGEERYRNLETYSTGMKQRLKLAQSLVHDPQVVFLDEPTNGLDPAGRRQILELIKSLWEEQGISVILSSHLLNDVSRICERVIIIAKGKILEHESLANLKKHRQQTIEVDIAHGHEAFIQKCHEKQWSAEILPNHRIKVMPSEDSLAEVLKILETLTIPPLEITPSPNMLEELFVKSLEESDGAL